MPKYGNCCRLLRNRPMWHGYVSNCTTTRKLQPMTEKRDWFWRQNLPSFVQPSQRRNWKTSQDVNGSVQAAQKNGTSPHWTPSSPAGLLFLMASIVFRLYGTKQYTPNNPIHTKNNITHPSFPPLPTIPYIFPSGTDSLQPVPPEGIRTSYCCVKNLQFPGMDARKRPVSARMRLRAGCTPANTYIRNS